MVLATVSVASTLAYFTSADMLRNTFAAGKVSVGLVETDTGLDKDDDPLTNSYQMIINDPDGIEKDPKVIFEAGNADSWLFVVLEESEGFDTYLNYALAAGWQQLTDPDGIAIPGVYYRAVQQSDANQEFSVLEGDLLTLQAGVTQQDLYDLEQKGYPTLTITAYVVQSSGLDSAYAAWQELLAVQE